MCMREGGRCRERTISPAAAEKQVLERRLSDGAAVSPAQRVHSERGAGLLPAVRDLSHGSSIMTMDGGTLRGIRFRATFRIQTSIWFLTDVRSGTIRGLISADRRSSPSASGMKRPARPIIAIPQTMPITPPLMPVAVITAAARLSARRR